MSEKHTPEALRLADLLKDSRLAKETVHYIRQEAAALLRTQHALLERVRDEIAQAHDESLDGREFNCRRDLMHTLAALNQHLEPK